MKYCPYCGTQLEDNATVCHMCQASLNPQPAAPEAPQPQAAPVAPQPQAAPVAPQPQANPVGYNPTPQPQANPVGYNPTPQPQANPVGYNPTAQPQQNKKKGGKIALIIVGAIVGLIILIIIIAAVSYGSSSSSSSDDYSSDSAITTESSADETINDILFSTGIIGNNTYVNTFIGATFKLKDGWAFHSYDEMSTNFGASIDEETGVPKMTTVAEDTYYDMHAYDTDTENNIIVTLMKPNNSQVKKLTTGDYIDNIFDSIDSSYAKENMTVKNKNKNYTTVTIGGKKYDCSLIEVESSGVSIIQIYALARINGVMVGIISSAQTEDEAMDILNNFE